MMSHRTTRPPVIEVDESWDSGDEAIVIKRDLPMVEAMQEDGSGEDSDEWKPEDHPPPSDDEDDEMVVDSSEKEEEEEEENDEEEEKEDEEEEEDEGEEDQHEEEKDVTMEEKEKGQDGQGKENEGGTSETFFIHCLTDSNIAVQRRDDVQIRPEEKKRYSHRILG